METTAKLPPRLWGIFVAVLYMILDVSVFWKERLLSWWRSRSPAEKLLHALRHAETFEEWEEIAYKLDEVLGNDLWRQNPTSKYYDYRLIHRRLEAIISARENGDILTLVNLLRSGLVRNLGNITSLKLYTGAYAGTKVLIDEYIAQVVSSIQYVASFQTSAPSSSHPSAPTFTAQAKLELLHDTRQAFGRTSLVLQGGSLFGLCHLGVVKALHLRGLLPRIITGTGTGALVAALVGVHAEDDLLDFLNSDAIDLSAFEQPRSTQPSSREGGLRSIVSRIKQYLREGSFLDVRALEECVRVNVGDMTFEEAFARSNRVLNITVTPSGKASFPTLLNYLTAPNVLIWSAALASNTSSSRARDCPVTLYCKDMNGDIIPWPHSADVTFRPWRYQTSLMGRDSPLARLAELFNVNHYIVSQTRPYLVPLTISTTTTPSFAGSWSSTPSVYRSKEPSTLHRLIKQELFHRLRQLHSLSLLPQPVARLLIDESIPGPSIAILPDLSSRDALKLFQYPTKEGLKHWISAGERGVWPAVAAIRVRCAIEAELDRGFMMVRRGKAPTPGDDGRDSEDVESTMQSPDIRRRRLSSDQITL